MHDYPFYSLSIKKPDIFPKDFMMSVINDGEILARIHKFKMFRKEGNLFIDLYEALVGKPSSKFIAVPNLIVREADKKYFGFGDSKAEALKDCLKKIKDVPIHAIVQLDNESEKCEEWNSNAEPLQQFKRFSSTDVKKKTIDPPNSPGKIYGTITDSTRQIDLTDDIIDAREKKSAGKPIMNAKITAVCKGAEKKKTKTNDSGYYEFTELKDGLWALKLKAKGYDAQEAKVEIIRGGEYEENFE